MICSKRKKKQILRSKIKSSVSYSYVLSKSDFIDFNMFSITNVASCTTSQIEITLFYTSVEIGFQEWSILSIRFMSYFSYLMCI